MPTFGPAPWRNAPFLRLVLPLTLGICAGWYFQPPKILVTLISMLASVIWILIQSLPLVSRRDLHWLSGGIVYTLLFTLGIFLLRRQDVRNHPQWIDHYLMDKPCMAITLLESPMEKNKSYKALGRIHSAYVRGHWYAARGDILLFFQKAGLPPRLHEGAEILLFKSITGIRNAGNPGEFDYRRYCLSRGITHQVFLLPADYQFTGREFQDPFQATMRTVRNRILEILRKYIQGEKQKGFAEALLLGYRDDLDKDLVRSYSNAGVIHIMAISGLHLGIIYLVLQWLVRPLGRKGAGRWLAPLITIGSLWLFSLLTGAQPSVLRAALMFTCISFAGLIDRKTSVFNSLAFSGFVLLCYQPFWLWSPGFQLSYAAVAGILLYMRPIYQRLSFRNRIIDFCWKLVSVSLAAQVLTLPVVLYHFHQFPNLFLLSNLFAVPLATVILCGEILLCLVSYFTFLAVPLGLGLSGTISFLNQVVDIINSIPFSITGGIHISPLQTGLLFGFIAALSSWMLQGRKGGLFFSLFFLLFLQGSRSLERIYARDQKELIVYNRPAPDSIEIIDGGRRHYAGISADLPAGLQFFLLGKTKILVVSGSPRFREDPRLPVDILIVSGLRPIPSSMLVRHFRVGILVIDATVPFAVAERTRKECTALGIPCYAVRDKGAFVKKLN